MRCYFVEIHKKEGFLCLGGTYQFTGKILTEWKSFPSYVEAQSACKSLLKDPNILDATVVSPELERVGDFYI